MQKQLDIDYFLFMRALCHENHHQRFFTDQCGATLTSPVGLITSPNYPEPYPSNEECNTTIKVVKGPIKVAFQAFDVGNAK